MLALLAILMAALAVSVPILRHRSRPGAPKRESAHTLRLVFPRGDLVTPPREFRWAPVPGASAYKVKIADADAIWPLFVTTTRETSFAIDEKQAAALTPGRVHAWELEAVDEKGAAIATGGTQFRVLLPPVPTEGTSHR